MGASCCLVSFGGEPRISGEWGASVHALLFPFVYRSSQPCPGYFLVLLSAVLFSDDSPPRTTRAPTERERREISSSLRISFSVEKIKDQPHFTRERACSGQQGSNRNKGTLALLTWVGRCFPPPAGVERRGDARVVFGESHPLWQPVKNFTRMRRRAAEKRMGDIERNDSGRVGGERRGIAIHREAMHLPCRRTVFRLSLFSVSWRALCV